MIRSFGFWIDMVEKHNIILFTISIVFRSNKSNWVTGAFSVTKHATFTMCTLYILFVSAVFQK